MCKSAINKKLSNLYVYKRLFEELFQLSSANTEDSEPITSAILTKITQTSFWETQKMLFALSVSYNLRE